MKKLFLFISVCFALTLGSCKQKVEQEAVHAEDTVSVDTVKPIVLPKITPKDTIVEAYIEVLRRDTLSYDSTFYLLSYDSLDRFLTYKMTVVVPVQKSVYADSLRRAAIHYTTWHRLDDHQLAGRAYFADRVLQFKEMCRSREKQELRRRGIKFYQSDEFKSLIINEDMRLLSQCMTYECKENDKVIKNNIEFVNWDKQTKKRLSLYDIFDETKAEDIRQVIVSNIVKNGILDTTDTESMLIDGIVVSPSFVLTQDTIIFSYRPYELNEEHTYVPISLDSLEFCAKQTNSIWKHLKD